MHRSCFAAVGCALLIAQTSFATSVTVNENRVDIVGPPGNSVTFDTANAATTGTSSLLPSTNFNTGSGGTAFRNSHNLPLGFDLTPTMFVNCDTSYPAGTGFNRGAASVSYYSFSGNTGVRDLTTAGWGSKGSPNGVGSDLLVMEWSNNEGYLVRVSTDGGANYSGWRYTPAAWSAHDDANGIFTWQTLVDYSDFGVAANQFVTNVQFESVLAGDKGTLSGSSYLLDPNGTLLVNPQTGNPFAASGVPDYSAGTDLTADIWYVASLNNLAPVPEPSTWVLGTIALAGTCIIRRRLH